MPVPTDKTLPTPDRYGLMPHVPRASAPAEVVAAPAPEPAAGEIVAEVRIVGNEKTDTSQIAGLIKTRAGRPFDPALVKQDVRTLALQNLFVDVKSLYERTPQGRVVIFQVVERPTIRYVSYLGNKKVSDLKPVALARGEAVCLYVTGSSGKLAPVWVKRPVMAK